MPVGKCEQKTKGRRYTENDKVFALALLKQTGPAYKYLSNIFSLLSRQTILKFLSKITIRHGFNNVIFDALKAESKNFKNDLDKYGMLILDEMSILTQLGYNRKDDKVVGFDTTETDSSEFANHAQVFMVRGIRQRWKQPMLINFHAGPAKSLYIANTIKTLVKKLKEAGFIVCSVICDQGTNNCAALSSLVKQTREEKLRRGEEMDISEFFFEVDGQKIIPLFDPPYLIKCVRNNLLKNNLVYFSNGKNKIAK
ncbi:unnamed protein product [Brassicogethes aeneus]|uniref:Transposable element P transposase-like RNase H domain-containing protein n=1 Tax=Brassicogethes aeneus TaxID=1431903 RepID=A0A9P0B5Z7_BRAAE|nr:unnamed protein product [Brassicogethes aeneus]